MEENEYPRKVVALLGQNVVVQVDRPYGSVHPRHPNIVYGVNYGYVTCLRAPDGEYQDAYILGVMKPLTRFEGVAIALLHRLDDVEDKLIVAPRGTDFSDEEIERLLAFQEQYFRHTLIR